MRWIMFLGVMVIFATACGNKAGKKGEKPLVKVYDNYLYPSDLKGIYQKGMSKEDSIVVVGTYIENWAKKNLMLKIAEENISRDSEIDRMVEEYRKTLIQHRYEQNLVEQRLDSVISQNEIDTFYQKTKNEYKLKQDIVRCYFIKVPINSPDKDKLKKWWKKKDPLDYAQMKDYCERYAQMFILEDSTWIHKKDLAAQFPKNTFSQEKLSVGKEWSFEKSGSLYLLRVFDIARKGKNEPVAYASKKIKGYILHKRKIELLKQLASEMYQRELNKKNVIIYQ